MTLTALLGIYFIHLLAAISPGPAVLLAARTSMREGMVRGSYLAIGIGLGACVWAVAALFGLAVVFAYAPMLLTVLKVGGAAYLIYLAVQMFRHAKDPVEETVPGVERGLSPLGLIWLGISTQIANPKPAVFFGSVFLTFLPPDMPLWGYFAVLGIVFFNDCGWNVIVARLFSLDRTRRAYMRLKGSIDRIFGGLLALLGAKLVLTN